MDSREEKKVNIVKDTLLIILGVVVGVLIAFVLLKYTKLSETLELTKTITKNGTTVVEKNSISDSVEKVKDSVVMIRGYKGDVEASTGTGFVYKTDSKYGYIMTNQHVVDGITNVVLVLSDDKEIYGTILGGDEYLDLAIIRINKSDVKEIAKIGDSSLSNVGDTVFTIGSPMGYDYRGTVTSGILSGKDRMVSVSVKNSSVQDYVMKVLQTDAAINPGNSGGPLLNVNGEVIGINSMKLVQEEIEGMGFAIPIEYAMSHVDSLEKGETIKWPVMGISMINVSDTSTLYRNSISLPIGITSGVVVAKVLDKSGASRSDLKSGDIIIAINGEKVKNTAYLRYELYKYKPGEVIEVTYYHNQKENKTKVVLSTSTGEV
ncbi:MAG: trypsin-like peptidase domain-containing protein [Bacilli bacterium]|nr:trypsin-like peptidase domain-containing protein [Bacilli bacterium]